MDQAILLVLLGIIGTGITFGLSSRRLTRDGTRLAPSVGALIPWLGVGLEFGWDSPRFFRKCWDTYGPNFRATAGGTQYIFLSSLAALDVFYRNRTHALEAFRVGSQTLGGTESKSTARILREILIPIVAKGNLQASLLDLMPEFNRQTLAYLDELHNSTAHGSEPISLRDLTSFALFSSMTAAIFGDNFPTHTFDHFRAIDDNSYLLFCNYYVLRWQMRATQDRMRGALVEFMKPWKDTNGDQDISGVSAHGNEIIRALIKHEETDSARGSLLISYLWGVFTNTMRILFWLFAHLLHDKAAYALLQDEIDRGVEAEFPDLPSLLAAHPNVINGPRFRLLDSALRETFRIRNLPTSYRTVSADVEFPSSDGGVFLARPGDVVVANTSGVHWDAEIFPEPEKFRVDRFLDGERMQMLFMFGKGAHTCTGREMAKYMMKMFVIIFVRHFDIQAQEAGKFELPLANPRSVGVMLPHSQVFVHLRRRGSSEKN